MNDASRGPRWSIATDLALGVVVGVFSGAFGVGGGIIFVPLAVLLARLEQKSAQATSLVVVPFAAVTGATTYAVAGSVWWPAVAPLIAGGLVGVWLGTTVVTRTPDMWLQIGFAALLLVAAGRLMWESTLPPIASEPTELSLFGGIGYVLSGLVMGFFSSMMGVGGGVIVIPLLVSFLGFSQDLAAGTSLAVMIPLALWGAYRLTRGGYTSWARGVRTGLASLPGAVAGAALALWSDDAIIQALFGAVLLFAAVQMVRKALS